MAVSRPAPSHCLREKGLPYQSRFAELWRYENLSPAYLKLNPNGVVPTLVHDGVPVINSFCINEYIEDVFPDPPLRPSDPHERARARYWAWTADDVHLSAARLTHVKMLKARVEDLSPEERRMMLESTPVPKFRERWRVLTEEGYALRQWIVRAWEPRSSDNTSMESHGRCVRARKALGGRFACSWSMERRRAS